MLSGLRNVKHGADKYGAIPGLVITTTIICVLYGFNVTDWSSSEAVAETVRSRPTYIAITVQIISHVLGLIQVQTICAVNFSALLVTD